jgi:hypothetical protein
VHQLIFPAVNLKIIEEANKLKIFDEFRKNFVALTPEEWVRQHLAHFLVKEKAFPKSLIKLEAFVQLNNLVKRADIIAYNSKGKPVLMAECKSSSVSLSQKVIDQICRYNLSVDVNCLLITNGLQLVVILKVGKSYGISSDIPTFDDLNF